MNLDLRVQADFTKSIKKMLRVVYGESTDDYGVFCIAIHSFLKPNVSASGFRVLHANNLHAFVIPNLATRNGSTYG